MLGLFKGFASYCLKFWAFELLDYYENAHTPEKKQVTRRHVVLVIFFDTVTGLKYVCRVNRGRLVNTTIKWKGNSI